MTGSVGAGGALEWYFDFISPYAYLQFKRLDALGRLDGLTMTPILFAAVLRHWGEDATAMAFEFDSDPGRFAADDRMIAALPAAATRRGHGA